MRTPNNAAMSEDNDADALDARLRSVRAKRRSMRRQAAIRSRDFALAGAIAAVGGTAQCVVLAARRIRSDGIAFGGMFFGVLALALLLSVLGLLRRHQRLRREVSAARDAR